jgi:cytochrome c oxidase subunit 1
MVVRWITSTDHKTIGYMYLITSFLFFILGGLMALLIRAELFEPGMQVVQSAEQYNQLFTMHGTIMLLLFATPLFAGFANVIMPLQIGAPDVAFPRMNMLAYWLYLFGGLIASAGFFTPQGAASFGWFAYAPLSNAVYSPGLGGDLWVFGLALGGFGTILGAVNFITTIITMRAPGMTMFRMPILAWNLLLTCFMVLIAFPVLTGALLMLLADRMLAANFFTPSTGGDAILWQHLFWFFGHPEVYIVALPYFGVVTEIIPVFSRKPLFGYKGLVLATISIAALSTSVWAHHMFVTGAVYLPFFAITTGLIAIPTGVKFFNWIGTMWGGSIRWATPMLFVLGFLLTFLIGGLTGVMLAAPALDFHVSDSYFVVAHFHYVMGGTVVFALFAGIYYWWPKVTGRMLSETLGRWHAGLLFIGFNLTFFFMHEAGLRGMPRRVNDFEANIGLDRPNLIASIGVVVMTASFIPFAIGVVQSLRREPHVGRDPWEGNSLEWMTTSPPGHHNFDVLPPIRSERPVFDLRWVEVEGLGATGFRDVWRNRQEHDEQWLPLHAGTEARSGEQPRDDVGGRPGDAPDDAERGHDELEEGS